MKPMLLLFLAFFMALLVLVFHHMALESRATQCSEMLHGYSEGTLVPITKDASVEIGACMLQFNQPIGED